MLTGACNPVVANSRRQVEAAFQHVAPQLPALLPFSLAAMQSEQRSDWLADKLILAGVEFVSTVAECELDHAASRQGPVFCEGAVTTVVPALLANMSAGDADVDPDKWDRAKASARALEIFANVCPDAVFHVGLLCGVA